MQALDQAELLAVYRRFDPNSAAGVALNALAALTGSVRRGATSSVVDGVVEFDQAGNYPNGSIIRNEDDGSTWALINGPLVFGGPGTLDATFQAIDTGPLIANAGTPWSPVTLVPGFVSFTNPTDDATIGRDEESDEDFRRRRQLELYSQNVGPLLSIQGVVSKVSTTNGEVTNVRVYHNPATSPADADGIPFKAFNVLVETDPPLPIPQVAGPIEPLAPRLRTRLSRQRSIDDQRHRRRGAKPRPGSLRRGRDCRRRHRHHDHPIHQQRRRADRPRGSATDG